jgi:nucleobase:cation symporter-1, NCS1 family
VDISWLVGLVVPGILYYGLAWTSMPAVVLSGTERS